VNGLFRRETFRTFGPHALAAEQPPLFGVKARGRRLREPVRAECPRLPGVYGMLDAGGELCYVGKAKCLRTRLLSYFRKGNRDEKAGKIVGEARRVVWELAPGEFGALLRELELIRRWQPRWNVAGQPLRKRRVYLCLGRRPAPHAFLAGKPPSTALRCYGPVAGLRQAREAARRLNDWFRLRDCPQKQEMVFADQQELFPLPLVPGCLRHEIGNCLAPCAACCTGDDYARQAGAARAFLEGKDTSPLEILEREMKTAAVALQYERAAALRDRLDSLAWLARQLERLREAATLSFVYPTEAPGGRAWWYLIRGGRARAAVPAPHDDASRATALAALDAVFPPGSHEPGPPALEEVDGVLLVGAWFRRHRGELGRTLTPGAARQACCRQIGG
jgi:excinuclease ABC subunit C